MHIQFAELPVFNRDRAKAFYTEHFGCQVASDQPMGPQGWRWIELRFPDSETTLHFLPKDNDEPSKSAVLVLVDDRMEEIVSRLQSKKVEILTSPRPAPWRPETRIAEFQGSEGNRIVISSR
jgi:predicted enzyme related to lactoylglutathione lyase